MPKSGDLVVGVLFIICGVIFLCTRTRYEDSLNQSHQDGHLTADQAWAKKNSRVWVGGGLLFVGLCLVGSYFLIPE